MSVLFHLISYQVSKNRICPSGLTVPVIITGFKMFGFFWKIQYVFNLMY